MSTPMMGSAMMRTPHLPFGSPCALPQRTPQTVGPALRAAGSATPNPASAATTQQAQGQGGGLFRPLCVVCTAPIDHSGVLTACNHFLCTRCVAKYPAGQCPRCQKPTRVLKVGASPQILDRLHSDPVKSVFGALQVLDFQRRQSAMAQVRLQELASMFKGQYADAVQKGQALHAKYVEQHQELEGLRAQRDALRSEVERWRDEARAARGGGGQQHAPSSQQSHLTGNSARHHSGSSHEMGQFHSAPMPEFLSRLADRESSEIPQQRSQRHGGGGGGGSHRDGYDLPPPPAQLPHNSFRTGSTGSGSLDGNRRVSPQTGGGRQQGRGGQQSKRGREVMPFGAESLSPVPRGESPHPSMPFRLGTPGGSLSRAFEARGGR